MTMTDPIADMLTRIRNANSAQFDTVKMPGSKLKEALAAILEREGFNRRLHRPERPAAARLDVGDHHEVRRGPHPYHRGIKRVSKPGLRIYAQATGIPRVLGGIGVAVVSTSHGLMTDREARKRHLVARCFVMCGDPLARFGASDSLARVTRSARATRSPGPLTRLSPSNPAGGR